MKEIGFGYSPNPEFLGWRIQTEKELALVTFLHKRHMPAGLNKILPWSPPAFSTVFRRNFTPVLFQPVRKWASNQHFKTGDL